MEFMSSEFVGCSIMGGLVDQIDYIVMNMCIELIEYSGKDGE